MSCLLHSVWQFLLDNRHELLIGAVGSVIASVVLVAVQIGAAWSKRYRKSQRFVGRYQMLNAETGKPYGGTVAIKRGSPEITAENWSDARRICRRVADQCCRELEGQFNAGSRITSARAHHPEIGRLPPPRDHNEARAKLRCVSVRRGSLTKDGGKYLAHSLFSSQNGTVLGLFLRRFSLRRPHVAAGRSKNRAAVFHGQRGTEDYCWCVGTAEHNCCGYSRARPAHR